MMEGYTSEKEQIESIKKWWNEQGKYLAIAVIIGLLIGFGWRYWQAMELRRAENASMIYQAVLNADSQKNTTEAQGGAAILMQKLSGTPYASLAALLWAKEAVLDNQLDVALSKLNWVIQHAKDARFAQMARISSSRILLSQNKMTEALDQLELIKDKNQSFEPLVNWIKGDIYAKKGDSKLAQRYYQQAKNELTASEPAVQLLNMKLAQPFSVQQ